MSQQALYKYTYFNFLMEHWWNVVIRARCSLNIADSLFQIYLFVAGIIEKLSSFSSFVLLYG